MQDKNSTISYVPQLLVGIENIRKTFKVGREKVFEWISAGAPIAEVKIDSAKAFYSAELMRLQLWLESYNKQ